MNIGVMSAERRKSALCRSTISGRLLSGFAMLACLSAGAAGTTVSTSFKDTTAPGWIFGGSGVNAQGVTNTALLTAAAGIDMPGNGWLRLTDTNYYLTAYALYTNAIPSYQSSIYASLDMAIWGGYADGFVLFFYDASVPFSMGGTGGALGYAQRTPNIGGLGGGYLGLGVDEFGNYSNPNQGKIGGPGQIGNGLAVRGPGSQMSGYAYIAGTGDGITPILPTRYYFDSYKSRPSAAADARHLEMLLSPNNQMTVYLRYGTGAQTLVFVADLSKYTRPSNLKMGFTAGTGGAVSFHELQNVFINATVGIPWDNTSGDSLWGSSGNWHPDGVPVAGSEIVFDNIYVHSAQTVDLGGATRTVRGLSFDAGFPYTLANGTLLFSTAAEPAGRLAISQSSVNGNGNMTIAAGIQISDDLTVDNSALGTLYLSGGLDTQGHVAYFAGMGAITVNGAITGTGRVVNYRSVLTLTNNSYSGGTLLQNGTTLLASDQAFGSGGVVFTGGTVQGANGTRVIGNIVTLQGTALTVGGGLPLTFTGLWTNSAANVVLTVNNTALTRFSGGISLADNNQIRTLNLNAATAVLVDSVIADGPGSGADGFTKSGLGTLTLSASNTYSGVTTVSAGTLALGASERIHNKSSLMLSGGTLNLGGYTETVSGLGYTNSTVDFGTGGTANYLVFTNAMASAGSLVILNFQAGSDHIAIPDSLAVSDTFVNGFYFSSYGVGATVTAGGQTLPGRSGTWKFIEPAAGQSAWDGGSTANDYWSSPTNWVGDVQPSSGSGVNVSFGGTTRLTPDLDASRTAGLLLFDASAGAFALHSSNGSTLTLDGNTPGISQQSAQGQAIAHGVAIPKSTLVDAAGGGVLTVSGILSGAGGIAKYGSGELSLTGNNSYAGTNVFYNGLVNIQNGSALGSTSAGTRVLGTSTLELMGNIAVGAEPLSLNSQGFNNEGALCNESGANSLAGPITLEGHSRINTDGGSLTVSGTVAGDWDLTVGGSGTVILSNIVATGIGSLTKDGEGTLYLRGTAANTFSGLTTVKAGLLALGKSTGATAVSGNLQIGDDSGTDTVRLLAREQISDAANVTLASSGVLDLNGFNETIANLNASSPLASVALGAGTLTVSGFDNSIFGGVISGGGALVKSNAGTLDLTGPNAYSGTTAVNGGVLRIEHGMALGNNTVAASVASGAALELKNGIAVGAKPLSLAGSGIVGTGGGALRSLAGDNSWAGRITLTAGASISSDAGTLSLSGVIAGAYPLTKTGVGTLTLSGVNTYSGAAISAGMLSVNNAAALGSAGNPLAIGGGAVLQATDSFTAAFPTTLGGTGAGIGGTFEVADGKTLGYGTGSVIGGTGSLLKTGAGTLSLAGSGTYAGGTTISAGTLSVTTSAALGLENNPLTIGGGATFKASDSFNTSRPTTLGGAGAGVGGTFEVADGKTLDYTSSSVIGGSGSLIKTGAGTLSLGGVDTYTGGTYIKAGTLVSTSGRAPGPQPPAGSNLYAHHIYDGATLQIAVGSWATERQVELVGDQVGAGGTAKIEIINGFTQQRNGLIYGTGKLSLTGTGTLIVANPNTYQGGTSVANGVLQVNNATGSATGSGAVTVTGGGTLSGLPTAQGVYAGITGSASGSVEIQGTGKLLTRSGGSLALGGLTLAAGSRSTFQLGTLTNVPLVTVTGNNAFTLPGGSTIEIVNTGTMGVGTYRLFDYTGTALSGSDFSKLALASSHSGSFNLALVQNTANTSVDLEVTAIKDQWKKGAVDTLWGTAGNWWGAVPNGTGESAQFIDNNGEAGFGTAETVTLDVVKTVGSIAFNNAGTAFTLAASSGQTLTLDQTGGNAVIQVFSARNDANHVIGAPVVLADSLTVAVASGGYGLDISGAVSGTGKSLSKTDSGPLTLSGAAANTYDGLTEVVGGTLNLDKAAGVNAIGTGGLQIDFGATAWLRAANQIADNATVTVNGTFALGTCSETVAALAGGGAVTTEIGSVLTIGGAADSSFLGTIGGAGGIAKIGVGTLTLNGVNCYSGGTTVNVGAVRVGADNNLGDASGEVAFGGGTLFFTGSFTSGRNMLLNSGGGTLDTDGSGVNLTGVLRGTGTLTKIGTGTVKLSNANTYSGATIINQGILRLGNETALGTAAGGTTVNAGGEIEIEGDGLTVSEPLTLNGGEICNLEKINTYGGTITLTADSGIDADGGTLRITREIEGAFGLDKAGPGRVELGGANTYSGTTAIDEGTLVLGSSGSLYAGSDVSIAAGATFDVSAKASPYTWGSGSALSAGGSGVGETAAVIKGHSGGVVSLGTNPIRLTFVPTAFSGDTAHPALFVSAGTLSLEGNAFTIDNASGTPLGAGTYRLSEQAVGSVSSSGSHTVSVTGAGLRSPDTTATLSISGGYVNLTVLTTTVTAWPTAATIANGQPLSSSALSGGVAKNSTLTAAVPGVFTFDAPETVPGAGICLAAVTFTPTDAASYNSVTGGLVRVNRFPVANANVAGTRQGQTLTISVGKLLYNDADVDGDTLAVTSVSNPSVHGNAVALSGGVVTYSAAAFSGVDTFTYTASDGYGGTAQGTVTVTVTAGSSGPVSLNVVGGPVISGNNFTVRFAGIPGYTYTVERTATLSPPAWQKAGNLTAPLEGGLWGIGIFEFSESTGGAQTRFYRTVWPAY